ncbi:MAG TPA: ABC transporter ATP-binding protein [Thermotogota bacterium]|nr:ABC transporter ATP-binding protein [Thermotogota bacterium]HRW93808.1 ABC transporter ATP-binding protein [Thermotogota bacterium]
MIEVKNFTKEYSKNTRAVDNISFTVQTGEIFGFLGPNGAGKSTTIKNIVGLLKPTSGTIRVCGMDVQSQAIEAKKRIGYVADEPLMMEKITGVEYLRFIATLFDVPASRFVERVEKMSKSFKLENALGDPISTYSHGMRQKLSLMSALVHNPDVWILDEPIVGLDPESAFILKNMMRAHARAGHTVFFSTHVMEIAEKICDRIAIISKGTLVFTGTVQALKEKKQNRSLESLFLEVTGSELEKMDFSYLDAD